MCVVYTFASLTVVLAAVFFALPQFEQHRNYIFDKSTELYNSLLSTNVVTDKNRGGVKDRLFTSDELAQYDGEANSKGLYLAILGKVYDVSKGKKHYGPGGSYHFFVGKDGSRAFVSGEFNDKGLTSDLTGLSPEDMLGILKWQEFYAKDYKYVGKLIGTFYDENGKPTEAMKEAKKLIKEGKRQEKEKANDQRLYPGCNSEWAQDKGGRVWCSTMSGGIQRDWSGVPRKYYKPGGKSSRCACVRTTGPPNGDENIKDHPNRGDLDNPNFRLYENCDALSDSCPIQ